MLNLLVAAISLAADGSSAVIQPGAAHLDRGHGSAGVAVGYVNTGTDNMPTMTASASVAPIDRLALDANVIGIPVTTLGGQYAGASVGVRYLVVDHPNIRFSPYVFAGTVQVGRTGTLSGAAVGAALEAGGHVVWGDVSMPLVSILNFRPIADHVVVGWPVPTVVATEIGLNVRFGEHHHARIGMASVLPNFSYTFEAERFYVGGTLVCPVPGMGAMIATSVGGGVRF